jgi:hypothetical protein
MSYDLIFLPKAADQSWEEALAAVEGDDGSVGASVEGWRGLLSAVRFLLGEVTVAEGPGHYDLTHEPSGMRVSWFPQGAGISAPVGSRGEDARAVVAQLYQLGEVVAGETGLPGFDPQLGLPLVEAATVPDLAVEYLEKSA